MPENAPVTLVTGTLPEGFCFETWQQVYASFIAATSAFLPGQYNVFNYGSQTPAAEDRGKPWFRLNNDGSPDRWYVFFGGSWVSPHPSQTTKRPEMWKGTLDELKLLDGGEDAPVTNTTGPFWERDTDFDHRMPVGVGTLPDAGTVLAVGDSGGQDQIKLALAEIPPHTHAIQNLFAVQMGAGGDAGVVLTATGSGVSAVGNQNTGSSGGASGDTSKHENMPPYRAVYFIKRTARIFYSLPG